MGLFAHSVDYEDLDPFSEKIWKVAEAESLSLKTTEMQHRGFIL